MEGAAFEEETGLSQLGVQLFSADVTAFTEYFRSEAQPHCAGRKIQAL